MAKADTKEPEAEYRIADLMKMFGLTNRQQLGNWADAGLLGEVKREDRFGNQERVFSADNVQRLKWVLKFREKNLGVECMKYLTEYAVGGKIQMIEDMRPELEN